MIRIERRGAKSKAGERSLIPMKKKVRAVNCWGFIFIIILN